MENNPVNELVESAKEALEYIRIAQKHLRYQTQGREFYPNREGAEACEIRLVQAISKAEGKTA